MSKELFSVRFSNLIGALGVSQVRFAKLCGLTQAALSQLLAGKRLPSFETLNKIHMATGVSIDYLMGLKLGQIINKGVKNVRTRNDTKRIY